MIVHAAFLAICALVRVNHYSVAQSLRDGTGSTTDFESADSAVNAAASFTALMSIGVFVLLIIWLFRMSTNARSLGVPLRHSNGMAIGGFFIPAANAIIPFRILEDIRNGWQSRGWISPVSKTQLRLWWWFFVGGTVLQYSASSMIESAESVDQVLRGDSVSFVGYGLVIAALVFGILTVKRMSEAPISFT